MILDRTTPPASETISSPNFPNPEIIKTEGVDLILLKKNQQPVIMMEYIIPSGRLEELSPGIAYFAGKMILEGTQKKSAQDIAETLDYHGSHLEVVPTLDYISIKLYCLTKFFESQINLVFELLDSSAFPEREFDKLKQIRSQQIKQQHAKTNSFSGLKFREFLFENHPYGTLISQEHVQETKLSAIKNQYQIFEDTVPHIFLAGDVSDEIINLITTHLKNRKFDKKTVSSQLETHAQSGLQHLEWDHAVQSSIRYGSKIINKKNSDIHLLSITNELLGGFFGSRLMKNIREEKGLTYGISSSIVHLQDQSYWVIGTDVLKEKATLAIEEIEKEIKKLQENLATDSEIETLKNYIRGKWLMSFDSCFNALHHYSNLYLQGLSTNYWYEYMDALENCTAQDIQTASQKYFSTENSLKVIVG